MGAAKSKLLLALAVIGLLAGAYSAISGYAQASEGKKSTSPMRMSSDSSIVPGSLSRLVREDDALEMSIDTSRLEPGAYTTWWVIFNNPDGCSASCSGDDLDNSDAEAAAFWATGGIVGPDGKGHFSARVMTNVLPSDNSDQIIEDNSGKGLTNPQGAEVHLVMRTHGDAMFDDAAALGLQLTSLNELSACPTPPGRCANVQFAIHDPKGDDADEEDDEEEEED